MLNYQNSIDVWMCSILVVETYCVTVSPFIICCVNYFASIYVCRIPCGIPSIFGSLTHPSVKVSLEPSYSIFRSLETSTLAVKTDARIHRRWQIVCEWMCIVHLCMKLLIQIIWHLKIMPFLRSISSIQI